MESNKTGLAKLFLLFLGLIIVCLVGINNVSAVDINNTNLTVSNVAGVQGQNVSLSANLTSNGKPISNETVYFNISGNKVYVNSTNTLGISIIHYGITETPGIYKITANFLGTKSYQASSGSGTLTVNSVPVVNGCEVFDNFIVVQFNQTIIRGIGQIFLTNDIIQNPVNISDYVSGYDLYIIPTTPLTTAVNYTLEFTPGSVVNNMTGAPNNLYVNRFRVSNQFTSIQINTAASLLQIYVETNHRLPNNVTLNNQQVTVPQFLQLMMQNLLNIKSGIKNTLTLENVNYPSNPVDSVVSGSLTNSEYLLIAQDIDYYININGRAPNYATSSLGKISYQNLVYTYCKILTFIAINQRLPNYVTVMPWKSITSNNTSISITNILNTIGQEEAQFTDVQNILYKNTNIQYNNNSPDDATVIENYGKGDCWADSSWLYNQLTAANITVRIMGYSNAPLSSVWYLHAWIQINIGKGWQDWDYMEYNSKHYGNYGGFKPFVIIGPGHAPAEISSTGIYVY